MKTSGRKENLSDFKTIFWDAEVSDIDVDKYSCYIIERILEYGDQGHLAWLLKTYSKKKLRAVLKSSRSISKKSAGFWKLYFHK